MRAIVVNEFGGPEVLRLDEIATPWPAEGEVTIDVEAAAVGLIDVLFRRDGLRGVLSLPFVPGIEVAGRVREIGEGVQGLNVGQRVVTLSNPGTAGYAEVAAVPASLVVPLDGTGEESAVGPVSAAAAVGNVPNLVTALAVLEDAVRMRPGDDVLVLGASGGLGGVFAGVARALGAASVTGVVSRASRIPDAQARGFDEVVTVDQLTGLDAHFHVVVDPVGGAARTAALALLRPLGRMAVVGNASDEDQVLVGTNDLWIGNTGIIGLNIAALLSAEPERAAPLASRALNLLQRSDIAQPVETLPLEHAAESHRRLESRSVHGRLALTP
ncbi:MAG TPA: zinc-binding dehydrogenase [Humibacter sp.]|jgi:NADPH2:quinone reductase|nr:zinc-binding dehydrogenase [Humibacter sp.]